MTRRWPRATVCGVLGAFGSITLVHPPATALVSGRVVDRDSGVGIARAVVSLSAVDRDAAVSTATTAGGEFEFTDLQPGRYRLTAAKAPYLTAHYGALLPAVRGVVLSLQQDDARRGLVIPMIRGGVVAGRVYDVFGAPSRNQSVALLRVREKDAGEALEQVHVESNQFGHAGPTTDDQGEYRLWGIPPGKYLVAVQPPPGHPSGPFHVTSADDVARASAPRVLQGRVARPPPGGMLPVTTPSADLTSVRLAPVYYPGTLVAAEAQLVSVGAAEERSNIDIRLQFARVAMLHGRVRSGGRGRPVGIVQAILLGPGGAQTAVPVSGSFNPEGSFSLGPLAPGRYVLEARTSPTADGSEPGRWASHEVTLDGDSPHVEVVLSPGARVSGTVAGPNELVSTPDLRFDLTPERSLPGSWLRRPVSTTAREGRFVFTGVPPGRYHLTVGSRVLGPLSVSGPRANRAQDVVVEVTPNEDVSGVQVHVERSDAEVYGHILNVLGVQASSFSVVVFSTDASAWRRGSSRIRVSNVDDLGGYSARSLPAGDYYLGVTTDLDADDPFVFDFLERLSAAALKVRVVSGVRIRQDIRIGSFHE